MAVSNPHKPMGLASGFAVIVLSFAFGAAWGYGFVLGPFHGWPTGVLLYSIIGCLVIVAVWAVGLRILARDLELRLWRGSESRLSVWKRPSVWSWAMTLTGVAFAFRIHGGSHLAHAAERTAIDFVIWFAIFALVSVTISPSKWERESLR
jgi:hypothetical protein